MGACGWELRVGAGHSEQAWFWKQMGLRSPSCPTGFEPQGDGASGGLSVLLGKKEGGTALMKVTFKRQWDGSAQAQALAVV